MAAIIADKVNPPLATFVHGKRASLDVPIQGEDILGGVAPRLIGPNSAVAQAMGTARSFHDFDAVGEQTQAVRGIDDQEIVINGLDVHIDVGVLIELQPFVVIEIALMDDLNRIGVWEVAVEHAGVVGLPWQSVAHPVERVNPLVGQQAGGSLPNRRTGFGEQVGPVPGHADFIPLHGTGGGRAVGGYDADTIEVFGQGGVADRRMPRDGFIISLGRDDVIRRVGQQAQQIVRPFILHDEGIVIARHDLNGAGSSPGHRQELHGGIRRARDQTAPEQRRSAIGTAVNLNPRIAA